MKVACSPEAWPPRRPPAPSTTRKVCSPEEVWPLRRPGAAGAQPARLGGHRGHRAAQTATIAAVLAPARDRRRRRLLDEELIEPPLLKVREDHDLGEALCGNQPVVGADNSSLSHFSAMTRPSWLGRAAGNRHRHAIEQASRRWRGGRAMIQYGAP